MLTIKSLIEKEVFSQTVATKMCKTGLGWSHLQLAYKRGGDEGVHVVLKEKVAGQVRVTNYKKALDKITTFLSAEEAQLTNAVHVSLQK